ncbi:hypothetical protein [Streptomyces sp. NPDC059247]|uniref:hypothetical protein n=1 Tax=Streptomyces sp. NPDC059247 TaxID=3346790 RepID=UPI0036BE15E8
MKLWELRSYEQVIKLEQERMIYQARLQARYGRSWRRKAPVEALMPLRLARYGVPLAETAAAGLAAAGIDPVLLPPPPQESAQPQPPALVPSAPVPQQLPQQPVELTAGPVPPQGPAPVLEQAPAPAQGPDQGQSQPQGHAQAPAPVRPEEAEEQPTHQESQWFAAQKSPESYEGTYNPRIVEGLEPMPVPVPQGPEDVPPPGPEEFVPYPEYVEEPQPPVDEFEEDVFKITWTYVQDNDRFPAGPELAQLVAAHYGLREFPPSDLDMLYGLIPGVQQRVASGMAEHDTA